MMQVLIAGAGPVGLAAANVLADAGIEVRVLEAEPQLAEALCVEALEEHVVDAPLVRRHALQERARFAVALEEHAPAVARVGGLLEDATRDELVRLDGDEGAGAMQPRGHLADRESGGARDEHQDLVLHAGDAGDGGEGVAAGVEPVAVGDEVVDQAPELGVRAVHQQRAA